MAGDCKSSDFGHNRFDPCHLHQIGKCGRVRLIATVLKTVDPKGSVSSNLTASTKECIPSVMAAYRSPKPLVKVRILGGMPNLVGFFGLGVAGHLLISTRATTHGSRVHHFVHHIFDCVLFGFTETSASLQ